MDPDLSAALEAILTKLVRAGADKRAAWRLPMLATVSGDRGPQIRTVVLRAVERAPLSVVFYTDARTPKLDEIRADPRVSLAFWDKGASQQLRLEGMAEIRTRGADVEAARQRLADYPGSDYARWAVPGTPIERSGADGDGPADRLLDDPLAHFSLVRVTAHRLDWLELARSGHRRAVFTRPSDQTGSWTGQWSVP